MLRQLAPEGATASGDPFISVEEANEHRAHRSACLDDAASALQLGAACVVPPDEDMGGGLTVVVGRSQSKIRLSARSRLRTPQIGKCRAEHSLCQPLGTGIATAPVDWPVRLFDAPAQESVAAFSRRLCRRAIGAGLPQAPSSRQRVSRELGSVGIGARQGSRSLIWSFVARGRIRRVYLLDAAAEAAFVAAWTVANE